MRKQESWINNKLTPVLRTGTTTNTLKTGSQEISIRTPAESVSKLTEPLVEQVNAVAATANKGIKKRFFRSKKRVVRYGLVIVNVALFIGVASFIISNRPSASSAPTSTLLSTSLNDAITDPLDTVSGTNIAFNISLIAGLPEAATLVHEVDAKNVEAAIATEGTQTVTKPQIIKTELKSKNDIQDYVVAEGDTVEEVAKKFSVSSDSVRWSNNITGSVLSVGSTIKIPPVDGIVYQVKNGDTPQSLASTYRSEEARIVAFNDAEIEGLVEGESIVIPDGQVVPIPRTIRSGAPIAYNFTPTFGGNAYAPGNCTWHTANRRAAVGKPVPSNLGNGGDWAWRARASGLATGNAPQQYAAVVTSSGGWGHVAFVEEVYADGSILMSEMNYNWVLYSTRTVVIPAEQAARYSYVY